MGASGSISNGPIIERFENLYNKKYNKGKDESSFYNRLFSKIINFYDIRKVIFM